MKKTSILILITFAAIDLSAQQPQNETHQFKYRLLRPPGDSLVELITKKNYSLLRPQARLSQVLTNGDRVYLLPQDNMPCMVPNRSWYNYHMSEIKGRSEGTIPNLSPPQQIIPREKNPDSN